MSPEEIRTAVEQAVQGGGMFPWWSYVLALLLPMLSAFFGSYLKQTAVNRANQEHFETLRDHLKKTTADTEEIKATLSQRGWLTQKQWEFQATYYAQLLEHLTKLSMTLDDRGSYFMEPGSEHRSDGELGGRFAELLDPSHRGNSPLSHPHFALLDGSMDSLGGGGNRRIKRAFRHRR